MKTFTLILVFCLCFIGILKAQDTIMMRNGDTVRAKILAVTFRKVKFYHYNDDRRTIVIYKKDVFMIKYKNGSKKLFGKKENVNISKKPHYKSPYHSKKNTNFRKIFHKWDTIAYRNGIAINTEALAVADFKLTYSHRIFKWLYSESMVSYNIQITNFYDIPWAIRDPSLYYGRFQVRLGLKEYFYRSFYVGEMFLYNNGKFNKGYVFYYNPQSSDDQDYEYVNRTKKDYEFMLKLGKTHQQKNKIIDIYVGIGYRYKYLNDKVLALTTEDDDLPEYGADGTPFNRKTSYGNVELHGGIQIGFGK